MSDDLLAREREFLDMIYPEVKRIMDKLEDIKEDYHREHAASDFRKLMDKCDKGLFDIEMLYIFCSAISAINFDVEPPDVHPESMGGTPYVAMMTAFMSFYLEQEGKNIFGYFR